MLKKILNQYHVIVLFLYLLCIISLSLVLKTPHLEDPLIVALIGGIPLIALGTFLYWVLRDNNDSRHINLNASEKFFNAYDWVILGLISVCFISITMGIIQNLGLFDSTFSYSLRLITTALHPLYPLESRLFHTFMPFALLSPYGRKKLKLILWLLYIILVFLLQVKIAPLYLFCLIFIATFRRPFKSFYNKLGFFLCSASLCLGLFFFTFQNSNSGFKSLYEDKKLQETMNNQVPLVTIDNHKFYENCKRIDNMDPAILSTIEGDLPKVVGATIYRTLVLPSVVSRLFICAWENDFKGHFRGHQLARITGHYLPIYNVLYRTYFPEHGNFTLANAVGNFVYDSYFQIGYLGVFFATLILLCILFLIESMPNSENFWSLKNLMKLNFLYSTFTASILSAVIFFVPLFLFFIYVYLRRNDANSLTSAPR